MAQTAPLLQRSWCCKACEAQLLPRRLTRRFCTPFFQDGPAVFVNLESFDRFEALDFQEHQDSEKEAQSSFKEEGAKDVGFEDLLENFTSYDSIHHSHLVFCRNCQRFLGSRLQVSCADTVLDFLLICTPYLQEVDLKGCFSKCRVRYCSGLHCRAKQCGQALFCEDSLLSDEHAWRLPNSKAERAWYINHFFQGAVNVGEALPRALAQGVMETAEVSCAKCRGVIGWKFVADMCVNKCNINQASQAIHHIMCSRTGFLAHNIQQLCAVMHGLVTVTSDFEVNRFGICRSSFTQTDEDVLSDTSCATSEFSSPSDAS